MNIQARTYLFSIGAFVTSATSLVLTIVFHTAH